MRFISSFLIVALMSSTCLAVPIGGEVMRGSSDISYGSSRVEINQHTDRAVIDWRSFDLKAGEHVKFNLPNPSSVALNRINDTKASEINGLVSSNGNLILLNPNGIVFGKDAVIDAAGIIASSSKVNIDEFMNGGAFGFSADGAGKIVNKGNISAGSTGLVGFVSPHIENHGVISAKLGKVQLASSDSYTVDLAGDGLINLAISDHQKQKIENNGKINAYKGRILLTASAAREIIDSLIINNGKLEAKTGSIKLCAEGANAVPDNVAANKGIKAGQSTIINNGIIDASGKKQGQKGGTIELLADDIALLDNSKIDASGNLGGLNTYQNNDKSNSRIKAAGGDIKIGGNYLGSGTTPAAKNVYVAPNAKIYADSLDSGDAGRVIIWADKQNDFYGNIFVRGGKRSGDGGFVETSGKEKLNAHGYVTTLAPNGKRGTYLLDPTSISIYGSTTGNWPKFNSTDGSSVQLSSSLVQWLDSNDSSTITLQFNTTSATLNANASGSTITSSTNLTSTIPVGSVIRVGAAGSNTVANSLDASTYVVQSISWNGSQTTVTLDKTVTGSSGNTIYAGYGTGWADKSTSGFNLSQTTAANQPLYQFNVSILNNKNSVKYNGSSQSFYLAYQASLNTANHTNFTIANPTGGSGTLRAAYWSTGPTPSGYVLYIETSDKWAFTWGNGSWPYITSTYNATLNQTFILEALSSGGQIGAYVNANNIASNGTYLPNPSNSEGYGANWLYNGYVPEHIIYNSTLSTIQRYFLEQYTSAKYAISLSTPGTSYQGSTESLKAMASLQRTTGNGFAGSDTADGYSVFTTRYLERLAASNDINLVSGSGGILLDLQGDTLTLPSETNLTLTTTSNGNITSNSNGIIAATRTTSKGNITLSAGGSGAIDLNTSGALALTSSGGDISLTAGGNIKVYNLSGKTVRVDNHSTATSDVYLNGTVNATATSGNSIIIASGRNLINNVGNSIYTTAGTARYLVYSYSFANNTPTSAPSGATMEFGYSYPSLPSPDPGTSLYLYSNSTMPTYITVTADNKFKFYNWPNPTFTYTVSGLPAGVQPSIVSGVSFTSTAVTGSLPGIYSITPSGGTVSGAYAIGTYTPGTITVIKTPPSNKCPCLTALGR